MPVLPPTALTGEQIVQLSEQALATLLTEAFTQGMAKGLPADSIERVLDGITNVVEAFVSAWEIKYREMTGQ
jgi:hypothetical protein